LDEKCYSCAKVYLSIFNKAIYLTQMILVNSQSVSVALTRETHETEVGFTVYAR